MNDEGRQQAAPVLGTGEPSGRPGGSAVEVPAPERRLLLLVELYHGKHGRGMTWRELARALGITQSEVGKLAWWLRRHGLAYFTREARSLRPTRRGLAAAIGEGRRP